MKQGLKLKQDFGNRGRGRLSEGLPQQIFGEAVMVGVKGGQNFHLVGGQTGEAAQASPEAGEGTGEAGQRPHVSLPGGMKVDAPVALLLLGGVGDDSRSPVSTPIPAS